MIRTYYVELEANIVAYGEAWVEVEEVVDVNGNVDEESTKKRACLYAMNDVREDRIDWESDGNVSDVRITSVDRD